MGAIMNLTPTELFRDFLLYTTHTVRVKTSNIFWYDRSSVSKQSISESCSGPITTMVNVENISNKYVEKYCGTAP